MSTLRITRRAADRLRSGHLWVYKSDIETQTLPAPGSLVTLVDSRELPLGSAIYSSASQIAARLISRTPGITRPQYLADLRTRIDAALQLRRDLVPITASTNAHRLIFSEADNLPGIIADRYNDLVLIQLLTQGTAQDDVRTVLVDALRNGIVSDNLTLWERPDPRIRELEQLPPPPPGPLYTNHSSAQNPKPSQNCHPERSEGPALSGLPTNLSSRPESALSPQDVSSRPESAPSPQEVSSRPESALFADVVERPASPAGTASDPSPQDVSSRPESALFADGAERPASPAGTASNPSPQEVSSRPESALFADVAERPASPAGTDTNPTTTTFTLNNLHFHYDAASGQKTGAFLDQRLNYAAAARVVQASGKRNKALDICTYQGGFALHLAQVCEAVTGIDASRSALEAADRNLLLNPSLATKSIDWIEADAFDYLRHLDDALRDLSSRPKAHSAAAERPAVRTTSDSRFDCIVLDPPAFAKSKRASEGALRGYKELNLRAIRLLTAGGTLVTNSCSHHVSLEEFTAIVAAAAADAGRRVQLLETHAAAPDHPEVLTLPETRYLKCLICRID